MLRDGETELLEYIGTYCRFSRTGTAKTAAKRVLGKA